MWEGAKGVRYEGKDHYVGSLPLQGQAHSGIRGWSDETGMHAEIR